MPLQHVNPPELHKNPAFSQAVVAVGPGKLVIVGGQNAVDASGKVVGEDLYSQSKQALANVVTALKAAGCTRQDVIRLGIYTTAGLDARDGYRAAQEVWGPNPTAIIVLQVPAFANPQFLVEIEAMAFRPD
jgi:enamine deaminase RidA (YjgF/YER057c/UK114 family)